MLVFGGDGRKVRVGVGQTRVIVSTAGRWWCIPLVLPFLGLFPLSFSVIHRCLFFQRGLERRDSLDPGWAGAGTVVPRLEAERGQVFKPVACPWWVYFLLPRQRCISCYLTRKRTMSAEPRLLSEPRSRA